MFASSHCTHPQVCFPPHCSPPHHASEFQSNVLAEYKQLAKPLMLHPLGYGVKESLPPVCSIHGRLSSAAFLQAHVAVLHKRTNFHFYFASRHQAPGDLSP